MLNAADIARRLNVSMATAYREMRRMLHVVVGRRGLRVSEVAFDAYLKRNSSQPQGAQRSGSPLPKSLSAPIKPIYPRKRKLAAGASVVAFEPTQASDVA